MIGKIVQFPDGRGDAWQPGELEEYLLDLHARLYAALSPKSTVVSVKLDVTDITELMQMIEYFIADEHFA